MPRMRTVKSVGLRQPGQPRVRARDHEVPGEGGDPRRVVEDHLGGGGAGELQRAALPGAEPELQDHLEREPLADQPPGVRVALGFAGQQRVHLGAALQVRRDHGGQPLRVGRVRDHVGDEVVQRGLPARVVVQHGREQRAEREGVRAAGDEPGAVGGVLHRVVEQERLLRVRELAAGEQLGDGHRGQAGQARAEEPGALVHVAGRAAVPLGGAAAFAVVPQVAEDEDAVGPPPLARLVGAGVAGRVERADAAAVGFEHQDHRGAALAGRARVGFLGRGGDEGAHQALVGDGGPVDLLRVADQVLRVSFRRDGGPAGPAAVPAVDGGQRLARRAAEGGLGLGCGLPVPAERRPVADQPHDPAQRPDPQVGLDVQERASPSGARAIDSSAANRARAAATACGDCRERRAPAIGPLAGQVLEDLVRGRRLVAEDLDQRVGEDVPAQHPAELFRGTGRPAR